MVQTGPVCQLRSCRIFVLFITAEKGVEARAMGVEKKEKVCTTECKSQRRLDETFPLALDYGSGEGGDDEKVLQYVTAE